MAGKPLGRGSCCKWQSLKIRLHMGTWGKALVPCSSSLSACLSPLGAPHALSARCLTEGIVQAPSRMRWYLRADCRGSYLTPAHRWLAALRTGLQNAHGPETTAHHIWRQMSFNKCTHSKPRSRIVPEPQKFPQPPVYAILFLPEVTAVLISIP